MHCSPLNSPKNKQRVNIVRILHIVHHLRGRLLRDQQGNNSFNTPTIISFFLPRIYTCIRLKITVQLVYLL